MQEIHEGVWQVHENFIGFNRVTGGQPQVGEPPRQALGHGVGSPRIADRDSLAALIDTQQGRPRRCDIPEFGRQMACLLDPICEVLC